MWPNNKPAKQKKSVSDKMKSKAAKILAAITRSSNPNPMNNNPKNKLKALKPPQIVYRDEEDDSIPLSEFFYKEYKLVINVGSNLFKYREKQILDALKEPCLAKKELANDLTLRIVANCIQRIFDIWHLYGDLPLIELEEYWTPQNLESNWSWADLECVLGTVKKVQKLNKKLYAA